MDPEKIAFIVNPISGGKSIDIAGKVSRFFKNTLIEYALAESRFKGEASQLTKKFVSEGYKKIIAVGGDGTVNEVARELIHTDSVLGIIPKGSGNGLARHLKIPVSVNSALNLILHDNIDAIDYGILNDTPFFCTAGVGFDAHIGNKFATLSGRGLTNYIKAILQEYLYYKPQRYTLVTEGQTIQKEAFLITIANASQWGNNAFIAPEASLQDGFLDVTIVSPFPKILSPTLGVMLFSKEIGKSGYVEMFRTKGITIERDEEGYIHFDGEPGTMGKKLSARIVPRGLKVIIPD